MLPKKLGGFMFLEAQLLSSCGEVEGRKVRVFVTDNHMPQQKHQLDQKRPAEMPFLQSLGRESQTSLGRRDPVAWESGCAPTTEWERSGANARHSGPVRLFSLSILRPGHGIGISNMVFGV
jgi:hypothetical protein